MTRPSSASPASVTSAGWPGVRSAPRSAGCRALAACGRPLTLLTATEDPDHGQAAVLARLLRQPADPGETGGEAVCFAHLVCPECGAVTTEGHRPGCEQEGRQDEMTPDRAAGRGHRRRHGSSRPTPPGWPRTGHRGRRRLNDSAASAVAERIGGKTAW